jgi:Ser/Thr protein kinase RdoA (MazF antagonist)
MTGGISSAVHRLTIDDGGRRGTLVLRQYEHGGHERTERETAALVRQEAATLRAVHDAGIPAPEPIDADPEGRETDGCPALLMTRLPGRIDIAPSDPGDRLRQVAAVAVRIHEVPYAARPFWARIDAPNPRVPGTATRPKVWEAAFDVLRQPAPAYTARFLHRDFQHFNQLWRRGRLTGVVDWAVSCMGPADFDIGHCRLNQAVLYGADRAERLRLAYEAEAGRVVDPWWDLYALTAYDDEWPEFIPLQVAGRVPVDTAGMTARVEDLLEATLARL